jgi:hypothetical protein
MYAAPSIYKTSEHFRKKASGILLGMGMLLLCLTGLRAQQFGPASFPPGKVGITQLVEYLQQADDEARKRLTLQLLPDREDYDLVFQPPVHPSPVAIS